MATMPAAPPNSCWVAGGLMMILPALVNWGMLAGTGYPHRGIDGQGLDRRPYGGDIRLVTIAGAGSTPRTEVR